MDSNFWSAVIVAAFACAGTIIGAYTANKKSTALIAYRLEQLERKVELHNNAVERIYELESRADVVDEKLKVADHRISDLEKT